MKSSGGYTGRFLRVNLTTGFVGVEETPDVESWLGPRGWNIKIAWDEIEPGVEPFDPENRIIFSAGPLAGTHAPTSGRTVISTIGARGYPDFAFSSGTMGGYWGPELKYAGYDGLVVQGAAPNPCYILIHNDHVSIEDASDLWGEGVFATQRRIKEAHGAKYQIAAIGPAGENRVRFASIIHRLSNAAGNSGFGGVMGAKNLKAIAVRGTCGLSMADPEGFDKAVKYVRSLIEGGQYKFGKVEEGYPNVACTYACSIKCSTEIMRCANVLQDGTSVNMRTCVDGVWARGGHPAYRGTFLGDEAQGPKLFVPRPPGLGSLGWDLMALANDMAITAWAYDTWYRYFGALQALGIGEIAGQRIELDSPSWWRDWILQVSRREGLWSDCAEGLNRFWEKHRVGPQYLVEFIESAGSKGHGWHREGRAMEPHPSPYWVHAALLYAVSTRDVSPSTHGFLHLNPLYGYPDKPKAVAEIPERLLKLAERIYGSREGVYPGYSHQERVTIWHQHRSIIKDCMPVCDWVFPVTRRNFETKDAFDAAEELLGDLGAEALLYQTCTGLDLSMTDMESPVAERIIALERAFEVRNHGRSRAEDETVIPHFQWPEKTDGTHLSADASEFHALLDRYYEARGWDTVTGWPKRERLEALGLASVADELEENGRLGAVSTPSKRCVSSSGPAACTAEKSPPK